MTFIAQDEINSIRQSVSIVDVISSYISLTQKGKNYFGVCPFHEDHSPSMSVSEEKQIYKCFSCGATGNVFTFVENFLNVSFGEAVSIIADKVGISIKHSTGMKKDAKYQKEYDIMELVLHFYQNNLYSKEGEKAIFYLKERGLLEEAIKDFEIGLSLDKSLLSTLLSKPKYSVTFLQELGLVHIRGEDVVDVFQNRIMFPIHDLEGHVIGFTARCYLRDITPKYLNTKETYIFKKGNILFNYHRAKESVRLQKYLVVVEGNMDAIRLYATGLKNVVALMGTSLTKEQIEALKKMRTKIILMLDNDSAGENATYTIGNLLEENNIIFDVVRLSNAKDPDEYVIKFGIDAVLENIKKSVSFVEFKLNYLKKNKNLKDSKDLASYIKAVIESLKNNSDSILKEVTLQKLANDYNISYAVLKEELEREDTLKKEVKMLRPVKEVSKKKSSYEKICESILFYMMQGVDFIKMYQTKLGLFPTQEHRLLANEIIYYYEKYKTMHMADFITYIETTSFKEPIMEILKSEKEEIFTVMNEMLIKVKKIIKKQEIAKLKEEMSQEFDENKKTALAEKIVEIKGSVENEDY